MPACANICAYAPRPTLAYHGRCVEGRGHFAGVTSPIYQLGIGIELKSSEVTASVFTH